MHLTTVLPTNKYSGLFMRAPVISDPGQMGVQGEHCAYTYEAWAPDLGLCSWTRFMHQTRSEHVFLSFSILWTTIGHLLGQVMFLEENQGLKARKEN
ncbi:hypothetical protein KY289_002449 [Solanum tuberosum]|nr:hypothetical protein KY289_002449 [Solanum tuberosum]